MINETIHYCWFGGGSMPPMYKKCIESWQVWLPNYEIQRWDETNTKLDTPLLKRLKRKKQWAFISDYIRFLKLYEYGGVYLDCDVEIVRPLDLLLNNKCFIGQEIPGRLNSCVLGSEKTHPYLLSCMKLMNDRFHKKRPFLIGPEIASLVYDDEFSQSDIITVLPVQSFFPYNPYAPKNDVGILMYQDVKPDTYGIHHWGKQWKFSFFHRFLRLISKIKGGL